MKTKVTKEEFEMLFASSGYTVSDVYNDEHFYFVSVKEQAINVNDIELLQIEGLELHSIGIGINHDVEVEYYKHSYEKEKIQSKIPL